MHIDIDTDSIVAALPIVIVVCLVLLVIVFGVCELTGARFWVV